MLGAVLRLVEIGNAKLSNDEQLMLTEIALLMAHDYSSSI
jgi:hypothetical protein